LKKKITDKDKKDWENFILNKQKIFDKDSSLKNIINNKKSNFIDLHGFSLENANKTIEKFINNSYEEGVKKITVVTGKGKRSKVEDNPYLSKELSILKNSVPEFIRSNQNLMKKIKGIFEANIDDGSSGAFYIYLKDK
tara:strand:+ start:559 stop:972 length:414 start_codon:yes stop_codon:yes gene_type:complete